MTEVYLSLVIPCFNERRRILSTLQCLRQHLVGGLYQDAEVIVVDDGSTDGTADLLRSLQGWDQLTLLFNETNRGKGYSVRRGVLAACGRYIFFTDADLPYDLEALGRFLAVLQEGYDLAIGARDLPGSRFSVPRSPLRRLASNVFTWIVRNYAVPGIPDTQCGFKGFRRGGPAISSSGVALTVMLSMWSWCFWPGGGGTESLAFPSSWCTTTTPRFASCAIRRRCYSTSFAFSSTPVVACTTCS